jgi:hypothetical protein
LDRKIVRLIADILIFYIPKLSSGEFLLGFEESDGNGGVYGVWYERGGSRLFHGQSGKRQSRVGLYRGPTDESRISFGVDRDVCGLFYEGIRELLRATAGWTGVRVGKRGSGDWDRDGDGR